MTFDVLSLSFPCSCNSFFFLFSISVLAEFQLDVNGVALKLIYGDEARVSVNFFFFEFSIFHNDGVSEHFIRSFSINYVCTHCTHLDED